MEFVADALAGWLISVLAEAGRNKVRRWVLGSDQELALRQASSAAVQVTAAKLCPGSDERAQDLAMVINQVFSAPLPGASEIERETVLQALQNGIARQVAVLDDAEVTGTEESSAAVLGFPAGVLAQELISRLIREIVARGVRGGPLAPLADQLNHDVTHLQSQRIEGMLGQLVSELPGVLARLKEPRAMVAAAPAELAHQATVARLVKDWDPFALDVHRAVALGTDAGLPPLPDYVRRSHDNEIDSALSDVSSNLMLVVTGGSATGKTRSLYEAVASHAVLHGWPLYYPRTATNLLRLITSGELRAAAVLWLDDCHQYLDGPLGEEAAAGLRHLLDGSLPGPVVVLSSMWQDAWDDYASQPASGRPDEHPQARQLLSHAVRRVRIAEFTGEQRETIAHGSGADARMVLAARTARSAREVIQVLTGGPTLVERLEHPDTDRARYASAIVMAALDLRRVGCYSAISHALLTQAAPAYLDPETCEDDPAGDWPETGLRWAATRVHGVRALNPYRDDSRAAVSGYQPHDYLEQHARRTRRAAALPEEVWTAIAGSLDDLEDMQRVADNAERRACYREAEVLWSRLVEAGQEDAIGRLFSLLDEQGRAGEIIDLLWRQSQAGSWAAVHCLADLLAQQGDTDKAIKLLRDRLSMVDSSALDERPQVFHNELLGDYIVDRAIGPKFAAFQLADLLAAHGPPDEAIEMLRSQVEIQERDPATIRLAELLSDLGRVDEAIELWRRQIESDSLAILDITDLLVEKGGEQDAVDLLRAQSDEGNHAATERLGKLYIDQDRPGEAAALWRQAVEKGDRFIVEELADLLVSLNRVDQAIELLRAQTDAGHPSAGRCLAKLLGDLGRADEAIEVWHRQIETGGGWLKFPATEGDMHAVGELADLLVKLGRTEEALDLLRNHSEKGNFYALDRLAEFLVRMDGTDEAFGLIQGEVNAGRYGATRLLAELADFVKSGSSISEDQRIRPPQDRSFRYSAAQKEP